MNYGIRKLDGQGPFDVYVVNMASGSKFSYWKRNTTEVVRNAVVVFDNKNANIQLQEGTALLSLSGMNNLQEMSQAIRIFMVNINRENVNIHFMFIVQDEKQRQEVEMVASNLGVSYEFKVLNKLEDKKMAEVEEKLKSEPDITASGAKTIEVQRDTGIEKITISDNKAYVNSGNLSIEREKYLLLQEWKKDPLMMSRISNLDTVALDRLLTEYVTMNLTAHRMESAREQTANDKVGEVAMNKASNEDGLVNANLGIVENNVSNVNQYSAVEQRGENVQVVNTNVTSSNINSGGVSSSTSSGDEGYKYVEPNMVENSEQSRDVGQEFYIDDEYNVYNSEGAVIGRIGQEGLLIDYTNNTLVKNGQTMGYVGDYNDMGKGNQNNKNKQNVRTLKKPQENSQNKSAAFVSLPVIMFVLSAMLLIGSIILLFVLD